MRPICLTLLLLLLFQQGFSQTAGITFKGKGVSLATVFASIEKQTDYTFYYKVEVLEKARNVDVDFRKEPLSEVLKVLFAHQPLKYLIIDKNIAVSASEQPGTPTSGPAALMTVSGTVMNKRGEVLGNASVVVKGTLKGTFTKADGTFVLENMKPEDLLKVSFIGYQAVEISIKGQEKLTIVLQEADNQLDEVVAQGYSNTTKRLSTSSVSKVSSAELGRQTEMNPLLALQGRVPGMVVTPTTTYAASSIEIDLRGKSLLSGQSGRPLIVIDGSPLYVGSNQGAANGDGPAQGMAAGFSPAYSQNPLYGLNPKDIESIEILKDVGATSIYGSAGANGVILITTKRGKAGSNNVEVNASTGFSRLTRYWNMLTTPQYLEMRREAFKNDGIIPTPQNAPDLLVWDTTRQVDWQKEIWGKMGSNFSANAVISGGTAQFTHRLSANYNTSSDITTASGSNDVIGVSAALDHRSRDSRFHLGFTANYYYTKSDIVRTPSISTLPPNAPPVYDETGGLNWAAYNAVGQAAFLESFVWMPTPVLSKTNSISANLRLKYEILRGLNLIASVGYNRNDNDMEMFKTIKSQNPASFPIGQALYGKSKSNNWTIEPQASYENTLLGKARISVVTGATIRQEFRENVSIYAGGYSNDALIRVLSPGNIWAITNERNPYKYAGIFGRMGITWDNKYVLELSGRRDGSSRFGPGRRYGNFGAIGLAWIASDEQWLKKILAPVISFLKFNANTGTAGQDGGSDYQYLSRWGQSFGMLTYDDIDPMIALQPFNQDYHWQLTRELNLGMDLRFFRNNLSLAVNYYRKRVGNQLTQNPTPFITGFPTVFGNWNATVQNEGWEAMFSATPVRTKNFSWTLSVNAAINRNKLLEYPDFENSPFARTLTVGKSTTEKYLLHYVGVDPMTGWYQFEDYNKDGWIKNNPNVIPGIADDNRYVFEQMPRVTGGMSHSFNYKSFSLNLSFDYRIQDGRNAFAGMLPSGLPGTLGNIPVELFNHRWKQPGDNALYAKFSTQSAPQHQFGATTGGSTLTYTDASFLRFRNINFSYTLPEKWLQRLGMKNGSLNITTNNLFVITRYKGIDPEIQTFGSMPPLKTVTAGFSVNF